MKTALTIVGSDCNGGAGIQANWVTGNGSYAMGAISDPNTTGVSRICAKGYLPAAVSEKTDSVAYYTI